MGQRALRELIRPFSQIDKANTNVFPQIDKANPIIFPNIDKTPTTGAIREIVNTNAQIFAKNNYFHLVVFTDRNNPDFSVKHPGDRLSFGIARSEDEHGEGTQSERDKKNLFHGTTI